MKKIPVKNCLECCNYDACEDFEDGDCPLDKNQSSVNGLHISHGLIMTVEEWAEFFGMSQSSIRTTICQDGTLDKLFARRVERELKKMESDTNAVGGCESI